MAPRNFVFEMRLPRQWAREHRFTWVQVNDGPRRLVETEEYETRQFLRGVRILRSHWPANARISVWRSGDKQVWKVFEVTTGPRADREAPNPTGEVTGRLMLNAGGCGTGTTFLELVVPTDPDVVAWGAWRVLKEDQPLGTGRPPWISSARANGRLYLGSTSQCDDDEFDPGEGPTVTLDLLPYDAAGNAGPTRRVKLDVPSVWVVRD